MNKTYMLPEDDLGGEVYRRVYLLVNKNWGGWQSIGATIGLAGGVLSTPWALLLWAAVKFLTPSGIGTTLSLLSNVLFALSLPLLALGASCLDLLEKKPPVLPLPAESQPASPRRLHHLRPRNPTATN